VIKVKAPNYVLVTPARNEEATIEVTIQSVIRQTLPPKEWVIVSDQSEDRTDEIVKEYATGFNFIHLLRLERRPERNFASVVFATEAGIKALKRNDYDFIGLLDADIRFGENYYAEVMSRFVREPGLGVAGGLVFDCCNGVRRRSGHSLLDVAGAVQLFRRECFDSLGGLIAIPEGGWDTVTCVQARMNGFTTRTIAEIEVDHLKPRNISEGNLLRRFRQLGARGYAMGNHPLFEVLKCGYRCLEYPFLLGGLMRLAGYSWCYLSRKDRMVSSEFIRFLRREQLGRLLPLQRQSIVPLEPVVGCPAVKSVSKRE
jgi:glycosyltransferase involved in cell wall biosynthesis